MSRGTSGLEADAMPMQRDADNIIKLPNKKCNISIKADTDLVSEYEKMTPSSSKDVLKRDQMATIERETDVVDIEFEVYCTYCQMNIVGLKIACRVCEDFVLCGMCFSAAVQLGLHAAHHGYEFESTGLMAKITDSEWTAAESLRLLNGVERYGYGNWGQVAEHIGTKTEAEAKKVYDEVFVQGTIGRKAVGNLEPPNTDDMVVKGERHWLARSKLKSPPLDVTQEEAKLLKYLPNRDEFEQEWSNQAEYLIYNNRVTYDREEQSFETLIQLYRVDKYSAIVDQRLRRKRMMKDYQLVRRYFDLVRESYAPHKIPEDRKELEQTVGCRDWERKMLPFCQYLMSHEYFRLMITMVRFKLLKMRIEDLKFVRRNGVKKLEDIPALREHVKTLRKNTSSKKDTKRCSELLGTPVKKRKRKCPVFSRKKVHLPHRTPEAIAAYNRRFFMSQP